MPGAQMSEERIKRPPLDRTEPIRNWSAVFGTTANATDKQAGPGPSGSDVSDAISRSVEIGYRVIDDYLRRGQEAAERLRSGRYGADTLRDDLQDVAGRLLGHISEFTATWLELVERSGLNGQSGGTAQAPPAPEPVPTGATEPNPIRLEIATRRRTEVALDLRPVPAGHRLLVHALRPTTADGPRITDVGFTSPSPLSGVIRVAVPDGHPAGTYSGLVLDEETNRPVGALTIVLREA